MITVQDRFEQYLLDEAWRAGLRKPDEVFEFVDYWRTTAPAQRVLAGMRLNAAFQEAFDSAADRAQRFMSAVIEAFKNRR